MKSGREEHFERTITRNQDKSPDLPDDIFSMVIKKCTTKDLGLFAQTSTYWRSEVYLHNFKQAYRKNQFEKANEILINIYLNYELLITNSAEIALSNWESNLRTFQRLPDIGLTNFLLATALILLMADKDKKHLENEFKTILYLVSKETPQLANSILAVFAQLKKDNQLFDSCKSAHNIKDIFTQDATALSMNHIKLIISPFMLDYKKQQYLRPILQEIQTSKNTKNILSAIHAMIKLLPRNHKLFIKPQTHVRDLMIILHEFIYEYMYSITPILHTIQSRIDDKSFIQTYYNDSLEMYDSKNLLVELLAETIIHPSISEPLAANQLEKYYYPYLTQLAEQKHDIHFLMKLTKYAKGLKTEENMITAINHLFPLLSKPKALNMPAIVIINYLLPKIHNQEFLISHIKNIFKLTLTQANINIIEQLKKSCKPRQLTNVNTNNLLTEFFNYHETHSGSELTRAITLNLSGIMQSEPLILQSDTWHKLSALNMLDKPAEWFKDNRNCMFFSCYLTLLMKIEDNDETIKSWLTKLYGFIDDKDMMLKSFSNGIPLLKHIKDAKITRQWTDKISQSNINTIYNLKTLASASIFKIAPEGIKDHINLIKNLLSTPAHHNLHEQIMNLLQTLPNHLATEIVETAFTVMQEQDATPLHIKNYIQQTGNTMQLTIVSFL